MLSDTAALLETVAQRQHTFRELRSHSTAIDATTRRGAYAKALLLRDALRHAARSSLSLQTQAVLAMLIAEAWNTDSNEWRLKMSQQQIANRGSCSTAQVKRHLAALAEAGLVEIFHGRARSVNRYLIRTPWLTTTAASDV